MAGCRQPVSFHLVRFFTSGAAHASPERWVHVQHDEHGAIRGFQPVLERINGADYSVSRAMQFASGTILFSDCLVKQAFGLQIAHSKPFLALPVVVNTPKPASQSAWGLQITL